MDARFTSVPVLVTGGAGFIGSHLVDALVASGARVRVIDDLSTGRRQNLEASISKIDFMVADIRDPAACERACDGVTYVFHQAALGSVPRSMEDPATSLAVNVGGSTNIFVAARKAGVRRVVYASSSSVYGDSQRMPKREGEEGKPLSPYALSKRMDEEIADTFARCYGMKLVGLRYFNVYGPRQNPNGPYAAVVPRFQQACLSGQPLTIFGDGNQRRDFTFIDDVVRANLLASQAPETSCGRAYNIGAGNAVSVNDLARAMIEMTRSRSEVHHLQPRAGDVPLSLASTVDAKEGIGFEAQVAFMEGIKRTLSGK